MRRTFVEISAREVIGAYRAWNGGARIGPAEHHVAAHWRAYAERRFYELAGAAAVPVARDGVIWERDEYSDTFRAWCDIPSPEGLLL